MEHKSRSRGLAPFASVEDLSDDQDSPVEDKNRLTLPGIREDTGSRSPKPVSATPRIDISRASSSSHHDDSSPERDLFAGWLYLSCFILLFIFFVLFWRFFISVWCNSAYVKYCMHRKYGQIFSISFGYLMLLQTVCNVIVYNTLWYQCYNCFVVNYLLWLIFYTYFFNLIF